MALRWLPACVLRVPQRREDDKRRGEQEGERLRRIKQRIEEEHGGTGDGVALGGGPAEQGRAAGEDVEEI